MHAGPKLVAIGAKTGSIFLLFASNLLTFATDQAAELSEHCDSSATLRQLRLNQKYCMQRFENLVSLIWGKPQQIQCWGEAVIQIYCCQYLVSSY